MKPGGGSTLLWECFVIWGSGRLAIIKGEIDLEMYWNPVAADHDDRCLRDLNDIRSCNMSVLERVEINQKESKDGKNFMFQRPGFDLVPTKMLSCDVKQAVQPRCTYEVI